MNRTMIRLASVPLLFLLLSPLVNAEEVVTFPSGKITLHGALYKPAGKGPFPAVVYNHGSAAGMLSASAFAALGPVFASHGWVFFGPYRRGQGLSASAGPYIGDQIAAAQKSGGDSAAAAVMVQLLETDHLDDQLAALAWLRNQEFVQPDRATGRLGHFSAVRRHACERAVMWSYLLSDLAPAAAGARSLHILDKSTFREARLPQVARAGRGSASDTQSLYVRYRTDRLRLLCH
jgi:hypothetical protein